MSKNKWTNKDIFSLMEEWAPKHLAYEWDNVGMQVGSHNRPVKKIMVTLDVMESVVDEAISEQVDLIIAHHPLLFKPIKRLNIDQSKGRILQKLLQHNITVYAAHTNLDIADGGVNDLLLDALDIKQRQILIKTYEEPLYKLAVYVPATHQKQVMDALSLKGVGHIGNYSHCTFQTKGQGTFMPLEGTNPFIGSQNKIEHVDEVKLETIVQHSKRKDAIIAMLGAHPYEEVAYDLYPLENKGKAYGIGRIGILKEKVSLQSFCEQVKQALSVPAVRVVGDSQKEIKKIAIVGGSGEKYINQAKQQGVDVLITGDMTFHTAQDALQMGLAIIDPGHHVEKVMIEGTINYLQRKVNNEQLEIIPSKISTEPFQFI